MAEKIVKVKIFRYNPDVDLAPIYKTYEVPWTEAGNVLQLLKTIYETLDRTIAFRYFSCGLKFCNGCMMTINGRISHACFTVINPGDELILEPLKGHPIIRDLVVDFGRKLSTDEHTYDLSQGAIVKEITPKS